MIVMSFMSVVNYGRGASPAGSAEELSQAGQHGCRLLQDAVILPLKRGGAGSWDGTSHLLGGGTQPRAGVGRGDNQGRDLDARQAAVPPWAPRLAQRAAVRPGERKAGQHT